MRFLPVFLLLLALSFIPLTLAAPSYNVKFVVVGLPFNTMWEVTVNGTAYYTYNGTIVVDLSPGSYRWSAPGQIAGGTGTVYRASISSGTLSVPSQALVKVVYLPYYQVNFTSGSGGWVYPSGSRWYEGGSTVKVSAKASTGYRFYKWVSSAPFIVFLNDSLPNTTVVISGSGYVEAIFKPTFPYWVLVIVILIVGAAAGASYGAWKSRKRRVEREKKRAKRRR